MGCSGEGWQGLFSLWWWWCKLACSASAHQRRSGGATVNNNTTPHLHTLSSAATSREPPSVQFQQGSTNKVMDVTLRCYRAGSCRRKLGHHPPTRPPPCLNIDCLCRLNGRKGTKLENKNKTTTTTFCLHHFFALLTNKTCITTTTTIIITRPCRLHGSLSGSTKAERMFLLTDAVRC